jgi:hypothetical protein
MKKKTIFISLALLGLITALAVYVSWPRNHVEIQVRQAKKSPDGRWTAVVQMEVYSAAAFTDDAVYAVRLMGPTQKDRQGDLVMNVPVNSPKPEPSIDWSNDNLVVTLSDHQKYQYFATPVDGVSVAVQAR